MPTVKDAPASPLTQGPGLMPPIEDEARPAMNATLSVHTASMTVSDLVSCYFDFEGAELSVPTLKLRKTHLEPFRAKFGHLAWDVVFKSEVKKWIRSVETWREDSTRHNVCASVNRLYNWAVDDGRIHRNPVKGLSWPEGEPGRSMTRDEYLALVRATNALFRQVLLFMRESAARPQDVAHLEWGHIDWQNGIALLPEHKTRKRTRKPKPLYLTHIVIELLAWIHRQRKTIPFVSEHVFLNARGRPWKPAGLSTRIERLRKKCGLADDTVLYGLRHSLPNRMVEQRIDPKTIADAMGNTLRTMDKYYLHANERVQSTRQALETVSGRA